MYIHPHGADDGVLNRDGEQQHISILQVTVQMTTQVRDSRGQHPIGIECGDARTARERFTSATLTPLLSSSKRYESWEPSTRIVNRCARQRRSLLSPHRGSMRWSPKDLPSSYPLCSEQKHGVRSARHEIINVWLPKTFPRLFALPSEEARLLLRDPVGVCPTSIASEKTLLVMPSMDS